LDRYASCATVAHGEATMKPQGKRRFSRRIRNGLHRVESAVGGQLENARITAEVKSCLLASFPYIALRVDVDTCRGVVYLRGEVADEWQKRRIEERARDACAHGVESIVNELRVNPNLPPILSP
jgi:osmotically-inducible protein OsmY